MDGQPDRQVALIVIFEKADDILNFVFESPRPDLLVWHRSILMVLIGPDWPGGPRKSRIGPAVSADVEGFAPAVITIFTTQLILV